MKHNREDAKLEIASWWQILINGTNKAFIPLYACQSRYLVLMGGGGSGKSIFAGRKILERCSCEPDHRWLVCRKVARTLRESCFKQLCAQLREHYSHLSIKINKSDMLITFPNGSEIIFAGLDDVEKLKSIFNITGIWIEEASELLETDFNQLDIRLRGKTRFYKQIILSFNPISLLHWLKRRFFDTPNARVTTHHSTYQDNQFLDEEAKAVLEGFRLSDPYYYAVYCLGQWGVLGKSIFDAKAITARLSRLSPPLAVGSFAYDYDGLHISAAKWLAEDTGFIKIYKYPEVGRPYVIGGDTAGDGSDCFVGQVLDNVTGEQVAVLRHSFDEGLYARQMFCLAMYYNQALIGIESNFSSYPNKELERLGYKHLFVREHEDNFSGELGHSFGFKTTAVTRPVIIAGLTDIVRENVNLVNDDTTLQELLTFVRDEKTMKPQAEHGAHDDCVIALAIAHYIRGQERQTVLRPKGSRVKWTSDQYEDYYSATSAMQQKLLEKWGSPW